MPGLLAVHDRRGVHRPGDHHPVTRIEPQQVLDAVALGLQLQHGVRTLRKERHQLARQIGEVIERQAVGQLAGADAKGALRVRAQHRIDLRQPVADVGERLQCRIVLEVVLQEAVAAIERAVGAEVHHQVVAAHHPGRPGRAMLQKRAAMALHDQPPLARAKAGRLDGAQVVGDVQPAPPAGARARGAPAPTAPRHARSRSKSGCQRGYSRSAVFRFTHHVSRLTSLFTPLPPAAAKSCSHAGLCGRRTERVRRARSVAALSAVISTRTRVAFEELRHDDAHVARQAELANERRELILGGGELRKALPPQRAFEQLELVVAADVTPPCRRDRLRRQHLRQRQVIARGDLFDPVPQVAQLVFARPQLLHEAEERGGIVCSRRDQRSSVPAVLALGGKGAERHIDALNQSPFRTFETRNTAMLALLADFFRQR